MEWTPEIIARVKRMSLDQGLKASVIGERLGVSKSAVTGKLRRLRFQEAGLPTHPPATKPRQRTWAEPKPPPNPAARYEAMGTEHKPCEFLIGERRHSHPCGEDRVVGKPFCPVHCAQVYVRVVPPSLRGATVCPP